MQNIFTLFLATEAEPALSRPVQAPRFSRLRLAWRQFRLAMEVLGNTLGLLLMLAGAWMCLQLLQAFIPPL